MKRFCGFYYTRSCNLHLAIGFVVMALVSSCTSNPKNHQLVHEYLSSHYRTTQYKLLRVNEPDSAYSPLATLLKTRHNLFKVNNNFEKKHRHFIKDDITNTHWSTDLYQLMVQSDSLVEENFRQGRQSMLNYKQPKEDQPDANAKIIRASLEINGDTIYGSFYFSKEEEAITHCVRSLDTFEEDLNKEYRRWLRLKADAQQDLENLSDYAFE